MSTTKRLSISTRVLVTIDCDAEQRNGEVVITNIRHVGLPSPKEVMEALDAGEQFGELDDLYEQATGG